MRTHASRARDARIASPFAAKHHTGTSWSIGGSPVVEVTIPTFPVHQSRAQSQRSEMIAFPVIVAIATQGRTDLRCRRHPACSHGDRVFIPASAGLPRQGSPTRTATEKAMRDSGRVRRRLLVTDHDSSFRTTVGCLIRQFGHMMELAESGSAGLAVLLQMPVSWLMTDLQMRGPPQADGYRCNLLQSWNSQPARYRVRGDQLTRDMDASYTSPRSRFGLIAILTPAFRSVAPDGLDNSRLLPDGIAGVQRRDNPSGKRHQQNSGHTQGRST
jgi:hypothetical protein